MDHEDDKAPSRAKTYMRDFKSFLGKRKYHKDILGPSDSPTTREGTVVHTREPRRAYDPDIDQPIFPPGSEVPSWHTAGASKDNWWVDGAEGRNMRVKPGVAAIFIHAGAGYHSTANERLHLDACSDAARAAMKLLKLGAPATEGVEAAIKILEDKEITNAGFGSNLAIDGTVACDATIVDHHGRSGACGAVPNIKNPISLAKMILDESHKPLSLRRVPPNLLVGKGAKDFAHEHGMPLVPNEWLVSRNARDRFMKWKEDLDRIDAKTSVTPNTVKIMAAPDQQEDARPKNQRDHTNAILTGTWNEGQPDSPAQANTPAVNDAPLASASPLKAGSPVSSNTSPGPRTPRPSERSPLSFLGALTSPRASNTVPPRSGSPTSKKARHKSGMTPDANIHDASFRDETNTRDGASSPISPSSPSHAAASVQPDPIHLSSPLGDDMYRGNEDIITDTVGAIAIDQYGNMAAGSSSGGIGMKHRSRVGPAALVGIGTAIIPANSQDDDRMVVGAVTSGTGEHMATTQAAQKCAERLYHGTRRGEGGADVEESEESFIMESFIINDFQNHPGVLNSSSASAIGAMALKQTKKGYYLYFAHNTDSFALASMCSSDRQPHCVMSRLPDGCAGVAQGARKIGAA
ncbi:hypothetical protein JX265_012196 [Neoarthrinium moseri]|uniref:Threonine aspartase n=1 Tax=Neoarthrinium moseri TaxID=1658444 RepID=A0A9Q0AJT5_9PEZI|nr:hypothetical protein JX266_010584 [Neoarthrinium moseri]KAI1855751.1 hypothetical protein JX265_012196 [Neoarthrinium moseri]